MKAAQIDALHQDIVDVNSEWNMTNFTLVLSS